MFINLEPTSWTPKESFYAIKHGGEYYPCYSQRDSKQGKYDTFIGGKGWVKSKTAKLIPLYTGTTISEFERYLKEYGENCLFYSITGFTIDSKDCVVFGAIQEFKVLIAVGFEYFEKFVKSIQEINTKIKEIMLGRGFDINERWITKDDKFYSTKDFFVVRPQYSLMSYFLCAPHVDVVGDDTLLWKHYVEEYKPQTDEELDNVFPCSPKDRLTFLFSSEVADMYEKILNDFPISIPKKIGNVI